jgi:hypothetical protein
MIGSTRQVAILRIALGVILWSTWGDHFLLYKRLSLEGVAVAALLFVASTAMIAGVLSRASTAVTGAVCLYIYYKLGADESTFVHHHTALLSFAICLLALTPCGRSLSVDRWLGLRRARRLGVEPPEERGDLWAVRALAMLVTAVYLGAVISKANAGWLSGDRFEMFLAHFYTGAEWIDAWWVERGLQLLTIYVWLLECCLVVGLWIPRARPWVMAQGVLMHWGFYILLPVATFSLTMVALYLVFFSADEIHGFIDRMLGVAPGGHDGA